MLSIKLTKRTWDSERIWMCGFPIMHLDKYLKILVQQYKKPVALCEEFRKLAEGASAVSKPTFERRVVRILTPGTLIDESFPIHLRTTICWQSAHLSRATGNLLLPKPRMAWHGSMYRLASFSAVMRPRIHSGIISLAYPLAKSYCTTLPIKTKSF